MTKITDVYLNGFVRAKGFKEKSIDVEEIDGRKRVTFLYDRDAQLDATIEEFREDELMRRFITEYLYTKKQITQTLQGR
mgnify:CR=1 FL=1